MNEPDSTPQLPGDPSPAEGSASVGPASPSRRRLIRAGASTVPVVATLASRPAHAWSCRSPSAWGSLRANPNTSLRNSAGHRTYTDETWTLTNWKNNTARSATGYSEKPWARLSARYPAIVTTKTKTGNAFDYTKVTVDMLRTYLAIQIPRDVSGGSKVQALMTNTFGGCCLAAQLNHIMLAGISDIDRCLTLSELKQMAALVYPTNGPVWNKTEVQNYLYENWIVRP